MPGQPGAPPPTSDAERLAALELQIGDLNHKFSQLIAYLSQPPPEGVSGSATNPGPPQQQGQPRIDPQTAQMILPALMQMGQEPDPFDMLVKQKVLTGMDLSNQMAQAFITMATALAKKVT